MADGPVCPSGIVGPVDPIRMFSQCKPDQPVAVGPVGQLFTTGPVGPCGMVPNHELHDPIDDSPVGLTEIPNPVDETERPIQIDFMKIVQTDGPVSVVDTPPSSDSGVHSWGEQWENMSISTTDTDTEQNGRPEICSQTGRCVCDTREPPNTKDVESDELSSSGSQNCNKDSQHNECMDFISDREPASAEGTWEDYEEGSDDLEIKSEEGAPVVPDTESQTKIKNITIRREDNSSVGSGTDGGNSDIGDLADFSAEEEESQLEQLPGCQIPGCQCEGRIEYMEWDSDDMTDSEDSEWEDPDEREKLLWVERYNYDLIEGMTLMTYTPPTRKNRRRRYEDKVTCTPEVQESNCGMNELKPAWQPRTDADEDIPSFRDNIENSGSQKQAGSDTYFPSGEYSEYFDRPVTESVTARTESNTDFSSGKDSEFFDQPVTEPALVRAGSDSDFPNGK